MAARLKERYAEEIRPAAARAVRLLERDAGPAAGEDHPQHGSRRGEAGHEDARGGRGADGRDRRAEARRAPRAQVDRHLQAARGHAGGRDGDAAGRAHVGDARSPAVDRDPADPGLPGAEPALVRRARQLLDGRARADHLSGDRLRRDRPGPGSERHDHHHGRDRRRGARAAAAARDALPPRRRRGADRGSMRQEQEAAARRAAEEEAREQLAAEAPAKPEAEAERGRRRGWRRALCERRRPANPKEDE